MISLSIIIIILFAHWVSDFIMQNDYMARGKSTNLRPLALHVGVYTLSMFVIISLGIYIVGASVGILDVAIFAVISGLLHFCVDYFTSKVSSSLHAKGKIGGSLPNFGFFTVIGFDQFLHYVMLFAIWQTMGL